MSSKTKKQHSTEPHAMSARQAEAAESKGADLVDHQTIRMRAYEIYLERGKQPGRDLDDWLQAERELATNHTGE